MEGNQVYVEAGRDVTLEQDPTQPRRDRNQEIYFPSERPSERRNPSRKVYHQKGYDREGRDGRHHEPRGQGRRDRGRGESKCIIL